MATRQRNPSNSGPSVLRRQSETFDASERHEVDAPGLQRSRFFGSQFVRKLTFQQGPPQTPPLAASNTLPRSRSSSFNGYHDGPGAYGLTCIYEPPEPQVDLIFVHGLHGGSFKTWRAKPEPGYFWPGEWLPQDPEFHFVRIHTFGYQADWTKFQQSKLSVNHFGESLHAHMIASKELNRGPKTPIILVGHSMGGLVIKKACLTFNQEFQSGQDPHASMLAQRIRCLIFLATPHHGSDLAERLSWILRAGADIGSRDYSKDYVKDLVRGSPSNESINHDFKYYAEQYMLYSFYETRDMPHLGGVVVDAGSACIGGPKHETTIMMNADHRSICKYESEDDECFRILRDTLIRVLDDLVDREMEPAPDDLDPLEVFLDCENSQEERLDTILEPKVQGTCQWIESRPDFRAWTSDPRRGSWLYWLHAPAGTGKSVTSASVFRMLTTQDACCFFFVNGNKYQQTIASLLRTLAFQMAQTNPKLVGTALHEMQRANAHLEEADEKALWRKLFVNCIFKQQINRPQYWIIDALDECSDALKLFPLLKSANPSWPLRIFLTSRPSVPIQNQIGALSRPSFKITEDRILQEDTETDIEKLLRANEHIIPLEDESRDELLRAIALKSHGSFLWASVVLREMEGAIDYYDIEKILANVPQDMLPHYEALMETMSRNNPDPRKKSLIRALLTWTVCSARPLTTDELQIGIFMDTGVKLLGAIQRTVEMLCGQILMVNKQGAVQVVHSTAREFLLHRKTRSEFAIRKEDGHLRLALVCLKYLAGEEMRPAGLFPGFRKRVGVSEKVSAFAAYAATCFGLHLVNGPADNDEVFRALYKFLSGPNVLTWIEYVAQKFDSLEHVKEAGANIRRYLERRSKHAAPVGVEYLTVSSWSVDLIRIVSKFGMHILDSPERLAALLPAVCPSNSAIYKQYSARNPDLKVVGWSDDFWADAIGYIEHAESTPTSIAAGLKYVAIGKVSGGVRVFDASSYKELFTFQHGEEVTTVSFNSIGDHIMTAGRTLAKYWRLSDVEDLQPVWTKRLRNQCIAFFFIEETGGEQQIMAATKDSSLLFWNADSEDCDDNDREIPLLPHGNHYGLFRKGPLINTLPSCSSFSPDGTLVAFAYSGRISMFSAEDGHYFGDCDRSQSPTKDKAEEVEGMLFNPNPDLKSLVVTYKSGDKGGELVLYDYSEGRLIETSAVLSEPYALSSTPDGRTLATGDKRGNIQIWDFESLTRLYIIKYNSLEVRALTFSHDGQRLLDLRRSHSVIWEPAVLVRQTDEEDSTSVSGTSMGVRQPDVVADYEDPIEISSIGLHPTLEVALVGKEDGTVSVYDLTEGRQTHELVNLKRSKPITHIALSKEGMLAYGDAGGAVHVVKLGIRQKSENTATENLEVVGSLMPGPTMEPPICQLEFSGSGRELIVADAGTTQLWLVNDTHDKLELGPWGESPKGPCWRFFANHTNEDQFQLIDKPIESFAADGGDCLDARRLATELKGLDISHNGLAVPKHVGKSEGSFEQATRVESPSSTIGRQTSRIRRIITDPDTGYVLVEYKTARNSTHLVILERVSSGPSMDDDASTSSSAVVDDDASTLLSVPSVASPGMLAPPTFPHSPGSGGSSSPASSSDAAHGHSMSSLSRPTTPDISHDSSRGGEADSFRLLEHLRPHQIRVFLGIWQGQAAYLGPHLWVRTMDLRHLAAGAKSTRRKHFFIPQEYLGGNHQVQAVVGRRGEVIFPRRGELAVVWGGLAAKPAM